MNSLTLKGSAVLMGGSGLVVGGYYGLQALDRQDPITRTIDNIQKTLEDQKYTLLTNTTSDKQTVIQKYKEAIEANDKLKLGDFTGNDANGKQAFEILLEQCSSILKNDYTNSNDLEKAKRWCVEPITASALLGKQKVTTLKIDEKDSTDNQKWEKKIEEYNSNKSKTKIDNLNLSSSSPDTKEQKIKDIKAKCKELGGKSNHEDKFDENLKLLRLWCSDN